MRKLAWARRDSVQTKKKFEQAYALALLLVREAIRTRVFPPDRGPTKPRSELRDCISLAVQLLDAEEVFTPGVGTSRPRSPARRRVLRVERF